MSVKLVRYERYKNSGIEWLGQIPEEWSFTKLKYQVENLDYRRVPLSHEERVDMAKNYPYYGASGVIDEVEGYLFDEALVLVAEDGANLLSRSSPLAFIAAGKYWVNNHAHIIRPTKYEITFLEFLLQAFDFAPWVTGSAQPKLTAEALGAIELPFPPILEQKFAGAMLRSETTKIETLVREQEELILLLKEKRQALKAHAVTKGLDPNAKMKPSGVEWMGDIPEGWNVLRIATLFSEVNEEGLDGLPILSVSIHDGVSDKELNDEELDRKVTRSEDKAKYKRVKVDDLVYNMMRAWQGGFGAVKLEGMVSPAYVVARPKGTLLTSFVEQILRTPQAIEALRTQSRGITDFRLRLYWDEFRSIKIALPSLQEQNQIMKFCERESLRIDALIVEAEATIILMQEHRSALISAVVTGKVRVPA